MADPYTDYDRWTRPFVPGGEAPPGMIPGDVEPTEGYLPFFALLAQLLGWDPVAGGDLPLDYAPGGRPQPPPEVIPEDEAAMGAGQRDVLAPGDTDYAELARLWEAEQIARAEAGALPPTAEEQIMLETELGRMPGELYRPVDNPAEVEARELMGQPGVSPADYPRGGHRPARPREEAPPGTPMAPPGGPSGPAEPGTPGAAAPGGRQMVNGWEQLGAPMQKGYHSARTYSENVGGVKYETVEYTNPDGSKGWLRTPMEPLG